MRALIVSYAFPPVGGAGVQRVTKLVKYLPLYGVTPTVLTTSNPSVPLADPSLDDDVPSSIEVLRAPTLEPGYATKRRAWSAAAGAERNLIARARAALMGLGKQLLVPDPQVLWLPGAVRVLSAQVVPGESPDVVFVSGPPFSSFVLGALARLSPGTAVVLDYRDEWSTTRSVYEMAGGAGARFGEWLEQKLLRSAHAITTATAAFRDELCRRFSFIDPSSVHTIENGYDPDDFPPELAPPPTDRFVVTYAGTVFKLTSARGLIEAVRLLHRDDPVLARQLELRFIGRIVDTESEYFAGSEALGVRRLGYCEHGAVIDRLAESHAVLCLLDDVPGADRIYPAKIFELMRLGRPCLALAPEGALAALIRIHRAGRVIAPRDVTAIAQALAAMLLAFRDGSYSATAQPRGIERFDRRRQAGEFAAVFRRASARARGEVTARGAVSARPASGHFAAQRS